MKFFRRNWSNQLWLIDLPRLLSRFCHRFRLFQIRLIYRLHYQLWLFLHQVFARGVISFVTALLLLKIVRGTKRRLLLFLRVAHSFLWRRDLCRIWIETIATLQVFIFLALGGFQDGYGALRPPVLRLDQTVPDLEIALIR